MEAHQLYKTIFVMLYSRGADITPDTTQTRKSFRNTAGLNHVFIQLYNIIYGTQTARTVS